MFSLRSSVLAVAAVLASVAHADYYIEPDSVSLSIRTYWCQSELSTCPIICSQYPAGTTEVNTCDPVCLFTLAASAQTSCAKEYTRN